MLIGADDGFYAVTSDGLRRIDNPRSQQSLSDQNVYSIFQDRENGLWIGTYFGGVNYFNPLLSSVETFVRVARVDQHDVAGLLVILAHAVVHAFGPGCRAVLRGSCGQPLDCHRGRRRELFQHEDQLER